MAYGVGQVKQFSPQEHLANALKLRAAQLEIDQRESETVNKLRADAEKAKDDAWLQMEAGVYKHEDGSPDWGTIRKHAASYNPAFALSLGERIDKAREQEIDLNDKELNGKVNRFGMVARLADTVKDASAYPLFRQMAVAADPELNDLPEQWDDATTPAYLQQISQRGMMSAAYAQQQREAIKAAAEGRIQAKEFFASVLPDATSQDEVNNAFEAAKTIYGLDAAGLSAYKQLFGTEYGDGYGERARLLAAETPKPGVKSGLQSKEMMVNGKPTVVNFDPDTGEYTPQTGVSPIRPQSAGGGGAAADPLPQLSIDPNSQNILSQTGLSINAFRLLTGQGSQLPRDQATRNRAANEAQTWARAHNVDISTLPSQYKTYNDVLSANISRLNNTKIMESELQGTIENLQGVAKDADLGRLNIANVAKIWAGQEVNDSLAQQYALHLSQLRNELSAYYAATQGRSGNNITIQDQRDAELVLRNGLSAGSLNGLQKAIENSTVKMGSVLQGSVERAQKQVWNLFGVGGNYKGGSGGASGGDSSRVVTKAEIAALALRKGTTIEQETARVTAAGYTIR